MCKCVMLTILNNDLYYKSGVYHVQKDSIIIVLVVFIVIIKLKIRMSTNSKVEISLIMKIKQFI